DGRLLWADSLHDRIGSWDPAAGRALIHEEHSAGGHGVKALALAPGGHALAAARPDDGVAIWDLTAERDWPAPLAPESWHVADLAFTPAGRARVAAGRDGMIRPWDTATWRGRRSWAAGNESVTCLDIAPDGRTLVVGGRSGWLRRWEIDSGRLVAEWRGHDGL